MEPLRAPESTHFHPFEVRKCPEPLQTRLLLALAWTTGDLGSRDALSPCSQVLRRVGRERLHPEPLSWHACFPLTSRLKVSPVT